MVFIDIPTERTTAISDAILAIIALLSMLYLRRFSQRNRLKTALWSWVFGFLTLASILGAIAHGLKLPDFLQTFLWHPLNFSLGFLVGIFLVAVVFDVWGEVISRRALPIIIFVNIGFFGVTLVWPNSFFVFVAYETAIMFFALGGYIWLAYRRFFRGGWLMVSGVILTIIASSIQASQVISFIFIWSFDHNGVFHLIQIAGLGLLVAGLRKALLSHE